MKCLRILTYIAFILATPLQAAAQSHFSDCFGRTGHNATIIIPSFAEFSFYDDTLSPHDEVAVFSADGRCAGAVVWDGENTALSVWGDDPVTAVNDGLSVGDTLYLRVWDSSRKREYPAAVDEQLVVTFSFDKPFYRTDGVYEHDAIYVVSALELVRVFPRGGSGYIETSTEAVGSDDSFRLNQNYPNPAAGRTTFSFDVARVGHVTLAVYDMLGREVERLLSETLTPGTHSVQWAPSAVPNGKYVCLLRAGDATRSHVFSVVK